MGDNEFGPFAALITSMV